jgi:hypothetical protein
MMKYLPHQARVFVYAFVLMLSACAGLQAQSEDKSGRPLQTASLHSGLVWQRTSPTSQKPEGPVLYQLVLNASGTPGTVPVFDTNPRHLINSPILVGINNVAIGGLSIDSSSGLISFANGQTFPASGLSNLAGEVTGPPGATVVSNAVAADTANAIVRRDGAGSFSAGTVTLAGSLALPNTASSSVGLLTMAGVPFLHDYGTNNTFVGLSAGNMTLTGQNDTAVGVSALQLNTTGINNSAFGAFALSQNMTGFSNSAYGNNALLQNTRGTRNSAFGDGALQNNATSSANSAFGFNALASSTLGFENSAFGDSALSNNLTGQYNSAFGTSALSSNTTGSVNSAFGLNALLRNTSGAENAAFGAGALYSNTTADANSAFGSGALSSNTTGNHNSAFGAYALTGNVTGYSNSAFGSLALNFNTGSSNSAFGDRALQINTSGIGNIAIGSAALQSNLTGIYNIALGVGAGENLTGEESDNIYINNHGNTGESNAIRIGEAGSQTAAFIAGISGSTSASGVAVLVNGDGQLGTTTSSRRFKDQIADLGTESDVLMKLRPVVFYYKPELDSTHTRQYGLVAEEVAQIAPNLVVFDDKGEPQTVRYHFVNAMLLNEVQKQRRQIEQQQSENETQQKQIALQQQEIDRLNAALRDQQTQMISVRDEIKTMRDLLRKSGVTSLALACGDHLWQ